MKMTLRQKRLLEELPKNNYNLSKSAKNAGYSDNTAKGKIYSLVRNSYKIKEYFNENTVKKELKKALKDCKNEGDRTNLLRSIELMSKILGMQIDKSENKVELITKPDEKAELIKLRGSIISIPASEN